jgi:hypothetical protein
MYVNSAEKGTVPFMADSANVRSVRPEHDRVLVVRQMIANAYFPRTLDRKLSGAPASDELLGADRPSQVPVLGELASAQDWPDQ